MKLSDIIEFRPNELPDDIWSSIESCEGVEDLRRPLDAARLPGGWPGLRQDILAKAEDLLDIRLLDVMRRAWMKSRELDAYRDTTKYPPDKTFRLSLVAHTIKSTHAPQIEVRLNNKIVGHVHFMATVEIAINGATLEIQNARIKKIYAGDCKAKGSFSCEGFLLVKRESKSLDLPGTIDCGEGIPL